MSICINNDLIWVAPPKCASVSIEKALIKSNLNLDHYKFGQNKNYPKHMHVKSHDLYQRFGKKDTVVIKRDYFDRWISGLQYVWTTCKKLNCETIVKWEDINNNFIYETFTPKLIDQIYSLAPQETALLTSDEMDEIAELSKEVFLNFAKTLPKNCNDHISNPCFVLKSQLDWVDNSKCTYEFNINEIKKFENFISNRYNVEFKVGKHNKGKYKKNQIIKDEKLKQWVWDNFEKRFEKRNSLI
jgi:hypothetical protein